MGVFVFGVLGVFGVWVVFVFKTPHQKSSGTGINLKQNQQTVNPPCLNLFVRFFIQLTS